MRLNLSTSWIFRGWIPCALLAFYAQNTVCKSLQCDDKHYLKGSRCCKKCEPGFRVFADCTDSQQTTCVKCARGEYQPHWTQEMRCLKQKYCDSGKGFVTRPENLIAEEPCRCRPKFQCSPINCEYCERVPTCGAGYGLEAEPESTNGRQICVPCKKGFFSDNSTKQCKQWTNCDSEIRPGSAQADATCGPPGSGTSWVIVSVLSVITVLCLLILLLFCYKDKLKLISVNLRSCVQNLKRTRIQQETLAPLHHSGVAGGAGGGSGGPKCAPCETIKLICQDPNGAGDELPRTFPTSITDVTVSLPLTETGATQRRTDEPSKGSGIPEEVSEELEVKSGFPLLAGPCVCSTPVREPLEVGENEDCSQAVTPGTPGTCSCRGLDGDERVREDAGEPADNSGEDKTALSKSEASVAPLISLSPALLHAPLLGPPASPHGELCLPLSQARATPAFNGGLADGPPTKQEELYRPAGTDSASTEAGLPSAASVMTSVSPLMTSSSSVGDLYLDKPPGASSQEQGHGLSWGDSGAKKLSSGDVQLECPPESLQSQLAEPTLTSGQVSGSHNTTFISSGQVMNFSGDVIVVYVSQTSVGGDGAGPDDDFGSPVQEQASEEAAPPLSRSGPGGSPGGSVTHGTLQDETLPVQEAMEQLSRGK